MFSTILLCFRICSCNLYVKNKILCALCTDRFFFIPRYKYGYVLQNKPSQMKCCAFEFEINKILNEDINWVMKKCDLHFLSMLRVAHTSQFESFDILSMCLLWRRIFFFLSLRSHSLWCNNNYFINTQWSWTRCKMWRFRWR